MKNWVLLVICMLLFQPVYAEEGQVSQNMSATSYQNISYEDCTKMYNIDKETLFYLAIGAVNANRFGIEEVQTNDGYVIFSTGKNKYLVTVAGIDKDNSIIKITPCNNLYYFQSGIISNIYKYIDLNKDMMVK